MYRIFCESYKNYIREYEIQNRTGDYRYRIMKSVELLVDIERYKLERNKGSKVYQECSDLLFYMQNRIDTYPRFNAFLWTLESREIKGKYYGVAAEKDLIEQCKIINMFLKLVYWQDTVAYRVLNQNLAY